MLSPRRSFARWIRMVWRALRVAKNMHPCLQNAGFIYPCLLPMNTQTLHQEYPSSARWMLYDVFCSCQSWGGPRNYTEHLLFSPPTLLILYFQLIQTKLNQPVASQDNFQGLNARLGQPPPNPHLPMLSITLLNVYSLKQASQRGKMSSLLCFMISNKYEGDLGFPPLHLQTQTGTVKLFLNSVKAENSTQPIWRPQSTSWFIVTREKQSDKYMRPRPCQRPLLFRFFISSRSRFSNFDNQGSKNQILWSWLWDRMIAFTTYQKASQCSFPHVSFHVKKIKIRNPGFGQATLSWPWTSFCLRRESRHIFDG